MRAAYRRIPAVPFHHPVFLALVNVIQRFRSQRIRPFPGVTICDEPLGQGMARVYRPEAAGNGAGLIWIHGGGFIVGDRSINDRECAGLARDLGLVVVSIDYRLAPKHPFPAALDDCLEAWKLLQSKADEWRVDRQRVAVLGQSAGGGLAATLVQRIADLGGIQPAAQVLLYPMLDDRTAADRELDLVKHRLWNNRNNRGGWQSYLGRAPGEDSVPRYAVAARRENLAGLPPAWVGTGERDLFYRENCAYAERLQSAGVPCELYVVPQAPHAFDMIVPEAPVSQSWLLRYCRFLQEQLRLPVIP